MIALLQRVRWAQVAVAGEVVARIGPGLLAFVAVEREDGPDEAARLAERVVRYRIFTDGQGRMNLDLRAVGGELLVVSQFTLAADTRKGLRPSFSPAAPPERARELVEAFAAHCRHFLPRVASGRFGAHMEVSLLNDGPVTFLLQS